MGNRHYSAWQSGETAATPQARPAYRGRRDRSDFKKPDSDTKPGDGAPRETNRDNFRGTRPGEGPRKEGEPRPKFAGNKPARGKFQGKGPRREGRDSGPAHRHFHSTAAPPERDRPADPNSPFAKLAALKEQMTSGRKDS